jgi:hypothetical protein
MSAPSEHIEKPPNDPGPMPHPVLSAILSLAVPGLGQVYQGLSGKLWPRLLKGCFFLIAVWGMFFYGFARSHWRNVYLPHVQEQFLEEDQAAGRLNKAYYFFGSPLPPLLGNILQRPQYALQFWAGAAAWPALWNYYFPDWPIFGKYQESPGSLRKNDMVTRRQHWSAFEAEDNALQRSEEMGRLWDIYWIYTVIAGAMNLLVVYDAYAGPVRYRRSEKKDKEAKR